MVNKLLQRLLYFLLLLLILNVITLFFLSEKEILHSTINDFNADGRMNSGTELILRDKVVGLAEEGTLEEFSNEAIRLMMEEIQSNRLARTVAYRPEPVSPDTLDSEPFELNLAVESNARFLFLRDIKLTAFNANFKIVQTERLIWFFKWRRYAKPITERF